MSRRKSEEQSGKFSPVIPFIIGGAMLIQTLNSTVIVNALPAMSQALGRSAADLNVLITIYLLAMAAFLPLGGWLADRFGSRTIFRNGIILYLVSSILCGVSQNLEQLFAARILAGIASAMLTPVGRVVLLRNMPKRHLVQAISYVTIPSMLGPVLGPPLGGFIVTYWSWEWIFFMNVPIGILAAILVTIFIPKDGPQAETKLDLRGAVFSGCGFAVLIFGMQNLPQNLISTQAALGWTFLGSMLLAFYWVHYRRYPNPILDFSLFSYRSFAAGVIGGQSARLLIGAMPFLLALLFQVGFGLTAFASGLLTFISAAAAILMKITATPVIHRFGFRNVLIVNTFLVALSFGAFAFVTGSTPYVAIIGILFVGGFCRSLQFTALNAVTYVDLDSAKLSKGSTLLAMSQPLSQSLGISIAAALVQALAWKNGTEIDADAITPVFAIMGTVSILSLFLFVPLPAESGRQKRT